MSLKDKLNPFKKPWWEKEEWHQTEKEDVHKIVEERGCPSWEVKLGMVKTYKNKDTCDERMRYIDNSNADIGTVFDKNPKKGTVFDKNPKKDELEWSSSFRRDLKSQWVGDFDLYEGPDYE